MKTEMKGKFLIVDNNVPSTRSIYRKIAKFWRNTEICDMCDDVDSKEYLGIILSGTDIPVTKTMIYEKEKRLIQRSATPILGICGGFQLMAIAFGARLTKMGFPLFGRHEVSVTPTNPLFEGMFPIQLFLKKHIYQVIDLPASFKVIASSNGEIEAIQHRKRPLFGVQFHPEYRQSGERVLQNFISFCLRARVIGDYEAAKPESSGRIWIQ